VCGWDVDSLDYKTAALKLRLEGTEVLEGKVGENDGLMGAGGMEIG
jgi:hypothetical protein